MGAQVYQEGKFKVYRTGNSYVVHNSEYAFSEKHSHIKNFNAAKGVIQLVSKRVIPRDFPNYLLISLMRLSDDDRYIKEIDDLIEVRRNKGKRLKYCNSA